MLYNFNKIIRVESNQIVKFLLQNLGTDMRMDHASDVSIRKFLLLLQTVLKIQFRLQ
jgi:hypothetical protein